VINTHPENCNGCEEEMLGNPRPDLANVGRIETAHPFRFIGHTEMDRSANIFGLTLTPELEFSRNIARQT
jgi:hypothetical protein